MINLKKEPFYNSSEGFASKSENIKRKNMKPKYLCTFINECKFNCIAGEISEFREIHQCR